MYKIKTFSQSFDAAQVITYTGTWNFDIESIMQEKKKEKHHD